MSEKDVISDELTETADPIDADAAAARAELRAAAGRVDAVRDPVAKAAEPQISDSVGAVELASAAIKTAYETGDESMADNRPVNKFGFTEDEMVSGIDDVPEQAELGDEDASPIEEFVDEEVAVDSDGADMNWYILKVQVNRESSICDSLNRRVKQAGYERFFGEILVPTENVKEFSKAGKQKIVKRKLYPGYVVVRMAITDDTWFLVRETSGIGDFTGAAGKPAPLLKEEIDRIISTTKPEAVDEGQEPAIKTAIKFKPGEQVRVKEGYFQNYEGEVSNIDERNGRITVMINIFGRPNPVELDHWQVENV